jgi:hypothetical protein
VVEIHPKEITGSWDRGYVLDVHTISSTMIGYNEFGHPEFDTVRSPLGELVYRLKYKGDKGAIPSIVEAITGFMKTSEIIRVTSKATFSRRSKEGIEGCFGGLFYFASFKAGRSATCTTLLLAARFDSIMASP